MGKRMFLYKKMMAGLLAALLGGMAIPAHSFAGTREVVNECADYVRELKETYGRYRNGEASYKERERIDRIKSRLQWGAFLTAIVIAYHMGKGGSGSYFAPNFSSLGTARGKDVDVVQIKAVWQKGMTCGFHAAVNAKNILAMLSDKSVDGDVTVEVGVLQADRRGHLKDSPEFGEDPADQTLTPHDVLACCKQLEIEEDYIIFAPSCRFSARKIVSDEGGLSVRIRQFKGNTGKRGLAIIINTGSHWIVDVIHKRDDGSYQHIIADSMNRNQCKRKAIKQVIKAEVSVSITP